VAIAASTTIPKRGAQNAIIDALSWRLVRTDGRPLPEVAFEESVVLFFLDLAELLGVPKSVGAIYGVCFASATPLSYSEVRARLNISAGSISQGLRVLREVGALKAMPGQVDGRELFAPDLEIRKLITHFLQERLQKQLLSGRGRLEAIAKTIPQARNSSAKELRSRLKTLQGWHEKTQALLPFVKTFLKLT